MKNVKITKKSLKLEGSICKNVSMLGISSFITQMSIVVVMAFENNLLGLGFAAVFSQAVIADEGLTQAEANTIVKEDIASAQVMAEVCPAVIGKNAKFDQNIQKLIQAALQDHADKSLNYDQLQTDKEYKSVLNEARTDAKDTPESEQKSVCADVLDYVG